MILRWSTTEQGKKRLWDIPHAANYVKNAKGSKRVKRKGGESNTKGSYSVEKVQEF